MYVLVIVLRARSPLRGVLRPPSILSRLGHRRRGRGDDPLPAPARHGGAFMTRSFIPHRCHDTIGVFAAVSAATAALLPASPVAALASIPQGARKVMAVEHPNGATSCVLECDDDDRVLKAGMMRTTRKLFDGMIF